MSRQIISKEVKEQIIEDSKTIPIRLLAEKYKVSRFWIYALLKNRQIARPPYEYRKRNVQESDNIFFNVNYYRCWITGD